MSIRIEKSTTEREFVDVLGIESVVTVAGGTTHAASHVGGFIFSRYCFGDRDDYFDYGNLVYDDDKLIGYAMCYLEDNEFEVRLLPEYVSLYKEVIQCIEKLFRGDECGVSANSADKELVAALADYECLGEERFETCIDLSNYVLHDVEWKNETIRYLEPRDVKNRIKFGDIPTHQVMYENRYLDLMRSPYYSLALDYVIYDNETDDFAGYNTWWVDEMSNTALLEPVACLPEFRRRGIMKRSLLHGLNELKHRGVAAAYVSTSIRNIAAQGLYTSVGFKKVGIACSYVKKLDALKHD